MSIEVRASTIEHRVFDARVLGATPIPLGDDHIEIAIFISEGGFSSIALQHKGDGPISHLFFTPANVFVKDDGKLGIEVHPATVADLGGNSSAFESLEGPHYVLAINYHARTVADVHARNVFVDDTVDPVVIALREKFGPSSDPKTISILVKGENVGRHFDELVVELGAKWMAESEKSPLAKWNATKGTFSFDKLTARAELPVGPFRAQYVFRDADHYAPTMFYTLAQAYEGDSPHMNSFKCSTPAMVVLDVKERGDADYFAFFEIPKGNSVSLNKGLVLEVTFPGATKWNAEVLASNRYAPPGWTSLKLKRPWDDGKLGNLPKGGLSLVTAGPDDDEQSLRQKILAATATEVSINNDFYRQPHKLQLAGINAMLDANTKVIKADLLQVLHGNSLLSIPGVNPFEGFTREQVCRAAGYETMNEEQKAAFMTVFDCTAGIWIVVGPPGTGKSTTMVRTIKAATEVATRKQRQLSGPIFVTTQDNKPADEFTLKVQRAVSADIVVARMHTMATDFSVFQEGLASDPVRPAEKTDKRDILRRSGEVAPIDRKATSTFEQASAWKHGIRDERLTLKDLSIEFLMKKRLQLPEWKDFLDLYNKAKQDVYDMTAKERNQYKKQRTNLYVDTIKKCDVVLCTNHAFGGQVVQSLERITATFTDEAAKASENQMIPILMHKGCRFFGLFGDQYQLPPHVAETSDENSLVEQAKLSLFKRLIMIGVKSTMLLEQFRMVSEISQYDSKLFYKGKLRTGEAADENHSSRVQITQRLKSFNELHSGNPSLLLGVSVDKGKDSPVGTSKYNKGNAEMVLNLVVKLLQANIVSADDVRILTPFRPQRQTYISALTNASARFPDLHLSNVAVLVATIDSVQGQENKVVVFDTVVTDKIGFLGSKPRINVAISRAQLALYQIVNRRILDNNKGDGYNLFKTMFRYLDRYGHNSERLPEAEPMLDGCVEAPGNQRFIGDILPFHHNHTDLHEAQLESDFSNDVRLENFENDEDADVWDRDGGRADAWNGDGGRADAWID